MNGFRKTWFQRIWGKVSVDNLVVCQRCRSLWPTCTSNALPHRWRNRYIAQGQGKRSLGGWSPVQRSCPGLRCLKVLLWTPTGRRFLCSSFLRLCNHRFSSWPCRVQSCFGSSSCQPSMRRRSRDALPVKGCTCRSGWSQRAFKPCLVAPRSWNLPRSWYL